MASRALYLFVATLAFSLCAAPSASQSVTVACELPFQAGHGVPGTIDPPNLSGFKEKFRNAFSDALTALATAQGLPVPVPSWNSGNNPPAWTHDTSSSVQSATATFAYDSVYLSVLYQLSDTPSLLFTSGMSGQKLVSVFFCDFNANTVTVTLPSPPPVTTSPPPPIFRRPPRPPAPSPVAKNGTYSLDVNST